MSVWQADQDLNRGLRFWRPLSFCRWTIDPLTWKRRLQPRSRRLFQQIDGDPELSQGTRRHAGAATGPRQQRAVMCAWSVMSVPSPRCRRMLEALIVVKRRDYVVERGLRGPKQMVRNASSFTHMDVRQFDVWSG